jgi:hypothetical protein
VLAATNTTLSISPTTVASLQSVTFSSSVSRTAIAGTPTGSVTFYEGTQAIGTANLSGGHASLTLVNNGSIATGTFVVTAVYSGDTSNITSTSANETLTVYPPGDPTSTTLSIQPASLTQGQSATFASTVSRAGASGTPTGTVSFYTGTTLIGTAMLENGTVTLTEATNGSIAPGTYAITASYNGDSTDQVSTSPAADLTIIASTTTTLTISPNPVPADSSVTMTAQVKQTYDKTIPTGTVTFTVGSYMAGSGTLSGTGTVAINLTDFGIPAGTYVVTASYSGDANNAASSTTAKVVIQ